MYVGQGNIAERLAVHRDDPSILRYTHFGLFVSWAEVAVSARDGVERYLADQLLPLAGERHPDVPPIVVQNVPPIAVNFPW